jgi:hypothetical protein
MTAYAALDMAGGLFGPPAVGALLCVPRWWRSRSWFYGWWVVSAIWVICWAGFAHDGQGVGPAIVSVWVAVVLFSRGPRDPKRAPRAYGAKSLARVRALARNLRRVMKPRPPLRPVAGER